MKHVIDRISDWIMTNGYLSDGGKSFTVTTRHEDSTFIAGIHLCEGFEFLHIGHYRTDGKACGDPEIVLQIRDGEFTCLVPPDSREDGDCVDRLTELFDRHLQTSPAPIV